MRPRRLACIAFLLFPATSLADEAPTDSQSRATALYDEAVRAMDRGDYALACRELEEVTRMVPDGVGAKFTLGECHEEAGRLATAYEMFLRVEKEALERGQAERSKKAAARAAALKDKLARLTVVVPSSLASAFDLKVSLGESVMAPSEWGEPRFVDKGTHRIVVEAKGERRWERKIEIADGDVQEIQVRDIIKVSERAQSGGAGDSLSPDDPAGSEADHDAPPPPPKRAFPVWQVVVGGFGLAAIGAGVAFKLESLAAEENIVDHCGADLGCVRGGGYDPAADNARKNRGFTLFVAGTTVGGVAIGAAVIGLIARSSPTKPQTPDISMTPILSPTFGGAALSGRF